GGSISARNIDVGTLVTAGTGNAGTPLFRIVQSDPLRVYVYAPQANAPSIREGLAAKILVQEFPGQDFDGRVTRTAGPLHPQPLGSARRAGGENESRHESNGRFGRGYSSSIDTRRKTKRRCERKAIIFRPVSQRLPHRLISKWPLAREIREGKAT